ncbi:MAG: WD40/YVTN/BNR-like repeat-containing protein [Phycisphaerae bacterium]
MSVCKTMDGGRTWGTRRNLGNEGTYWTSCRDIAVAPSNPSIVYAVGQVDDYVKIWRSDDAGNSWVDITGNLDSFHSRYDLVYAIWVEPDDPYALVVGTSKGVYKTRPPVGRDTTTRDWIRTPLRHSTRAFAYDQAKDILYAATEIEGVYYSEDRGTSWLELNDGLDYLKTLCIGLDSENDILYIGTDGGSVWRLDLGETSLSDVDLNIELY